MKQEIIRLDQLTMGTIKYSDITLIQEKETEIISSDSLWRGIHEYYNGLVKSNIGNGKKVILQIHSKKEFILLFMALIRTGACPIILPVSMTKNSANMLQKICSDNQDAIIMADDMGKVCVQTLLPDIKLPLLSIKEFVCQDENIETDYNDFSDNIADDVAFVIYSSGSTSEPKGVMVTHKGVIRMLQETAKILGLTKEDVLLSWLPVEHTFGLIYFLLLPIYVGCRQVHMATSMFAENPLTWLEQINHYRANKTYYKILEHPLYGRMADTGIIGVLTHDGYMEFVVPNCETSVETPDKKEDTHEEEIEKPIVKEIMKIWKEVFEIEDISIQDDFYTLGGDSIILMRLVDEMCKTLGCDVTVDDILQSENISDLANRV